VICPSLSYVRTGLVSETLVHYKLLRWGHDAVSMSQDFAYDLLVLDDAPIRIQVKSTAKKPPAGSHQFRLCRGADKKYSPGDYDILALVALDLERVHFTLYLDQLTVRVPFSKLGTEDEHHSWLAALDSLKQ